ncbi:MAG: 50S ribosomal protein L24 [bacterium]
MLKLKKGDKVKVVAGKDKGKEGLITRVIRKENAVIVAGANLYKKHVKPTQNKEGGMISMERPLNVGKVALLEGGKTVRVGFKLEAGKKLRISKSTGGNL